MYFTLVRRVKTKIRTAKRRFQKLVRKYNKASVKRRVIGISLLSRLASLMFALAFVPAVGAQAPEANGLQVTGNLQFAPDTAELVRVTEANPLEIQVTESAFEREQREGAAAQARTKAPRQTRTARIAVVVTAASNCPGSFRDVYQKAGSAFGVPWQILEAIHQVESGKSCHMNRRSSAGAQGPMQFLPSTWRHYATDGDGDGRADITNAYDAIYTASHYVGTGVHGWTLKGASRQEAIYKGIWSYNHADWYVQKVLNIAREIGFEG